MKKIQSVEFEEVRMEAVTSIAVGTTLTVGKGKTAVTLSAQEVLELRDWLNYLTGRVPTLTVASYIPGGVTSSAVVAGSAVGETAAEPKDVVPDDPLLPPGYVRMEDRGRLVDGKGKIIPFKSDGVPDALTVSKRISVKDALKREGMELYDRSAELGKGAIVVKVGPAPKGAHGDGK